MIRQYWGGRDGTKGVGGTLMKEFILGARSATVAIRLADAAISLNCERRIAHNPRPYETDQLEHPGWAA
jgi:hypothetical protein